MPLSIPQLLRLGNDIGYRTHADLHTPAIEHIGARSMRWKTSTSRPKLTVMLIRDLVPNDIDDSWAINQANTPAVSSVSRDEFARLVEMSTASVVAVIDDKLAGYAIVIGPGEDYSSPNYRWFSERYEDFAYLDRVAIAGTHQRLGIGRAIYNEIIERLAPKFPVLLLEVNVQPRNEPSLAFHDDLGFVEVGQQDTYGGKVRVSLQELPLH